MAQGGLVLSAQLDHIRGFLTVLLSIKQSKRQARAALRGPLHWALTPPAPLQRIW